jgi:hypothetical protein
MTTLRSFALCSLALLAPLAAQEQLRRGTSNEALIDDRLRASVARAHEWLAAHQHKDGYWAELVGYKLNSNYETTDDNPLPHVGVSALALMSFLAGGHLPDRGKYGDVLHRGIDFVLTCSQDDGQIAAHGTRMYSHAFATLFLAEVHGMAASDRTKLTLERAINLIVDCQNAHGGWRYNPFDRELDLSVTVCQIQALRAARNIGIRVPPDAIDKAMAYVQASRVERGPMQGLYYYKIHGRGAYDKPTEYAINAAALTALSCAGIHDDDLSDPVLRFLAREYETLADPYYRTHFYYWYGNYYAAQAFYQSGGPRLRAYWTRLATDLLAAQAADGRWQNTVGPGDEFATAIACLLLQMPKQYLPIFQR